MNAHTKPTASVSPSFRPLTLVSALLLAVTFTANAATDTWSGSVNGVWDTSTLNWNSGATAFTSANDALFTGTPANNVTVATGLTIGAITLDNTFTGSVTMSGANTVSGATAISGGTLSLNVGNGLGSSAITVNNGGILNLSAGNATYANAVSGAGVANVTTAAAGDATLTGNWSGFTGTLNLNGSGNFKTRFTTASQADVISSSATININAGTTLYLNQALNYGASVHLFGAGNSENLGALRIEGGTQTGSVTLHANSFIGNNAAATIGGAIGETGGSFGFTKQGGNTLTLSGNNSFTGPLILNNGTVSVGSDSAGAYNLGGATGNNGITFDGGTLKITGTTMTSLGSHTPTVNAGKTAVLEIADAANNFTVGQNMTTTGGLAKTGAGTLSLSGISSFGGSLTVHNGTVGIPSGSLALGGFSFMGRTASQSGVVSVSSGATLNFNHANGGGFGYASQSSGALYNSGSFSATQFYMSDTANNNSYGYFRNAATMTFGNTLAIGRGNNASLLDIVGGTVTLTPTANGGLAFAAGAGSVAGLNISSGATFTLLGTGRQQFINQGAGAYTSINITGSGSKLVGPSASGFCLMNTANANNFTTFSLASGGEFDTQYMFNNNTTYGACVFNFNNGILKATGSDANGLINNNTAVYIHSGGATIDVNGTTSKINVPILAPSGNGVTGITLGGTTSGYIGAPIVKIARGAGDTTGQGAAAIATFDPSSGTVTGITITSPGSGYTATPTVTLVGGNGGSTGGNAGTATATATIGTVSGGGLTIADSTGNGRLTLTAAGNTYTGDTTINAGTLLVNSPGSLGNTAVAVKTGATLGGNGTVGGAVMVEAGGTLAPGTSIGTLTLGSLTLNSGATAAMELGDSLTADKAAASGAVVYGGTLKLIWAGTTPTTGTVDLFDGSGFSGSFSSLQLSNWPSAYRVSANNLTSDGTITIAVNAAPVAQNLTMGVAQGDSATLPIIGGKHAPFDADGDAMSVTAVNLVTPANGAAVSVVGGTSVVYTASSSFSGSDSFTYTVTDAFGAADIKTVSVTVTAAATGANILPGSLSVNDGVATMQGFGIPGALYQLQYTTSLSPVNWQDVADGNVQASPNGALSLTDSDAGGPSRFYRTRYVSGP